MMDLRNIINDDDNDEDIVRILRSVDWWLVICYSEQPISHKFKGQTTSN